MKITDLNKAAKILDSIKEVDTKILSIEKFAELVVNGITKSSFDLKIQNLAPNQKIPLPDEDGSLVNIFSEMRREMSKSMYAFGGFMGDSPRQQKKDNNDTLSVDLSENETLQFLGLILGVKQRERQKLLEKLEAFGVA
jgi:hypothetical protein